ncbi:PhzF family phenazine biosynthesis protein [Gemella cuniculi]|uniref:PhzF family phenazine biosynthesis protein n=1 Tax=Gemella cuniculi TaxID=150240 RepID=UPI000480876D|nr:PhzF family phenazine biosynthesis protein [Gemella cuniculi]
MRQYIVDAFADKIFSGNPAAVCVLDEDISEDLMMKITRENNLSETAFAVKIGEEKYDLRWFTPGGEIDLCGHATLGAAYVIMNYYEPKLTKVKFKTMSGELVVVKKDNLYEMNFPMYELKEVKVTNEMIEAIGIEPAYALLGRDLVCVFDNEEDIWKITPDLDKVKKLEGLLLHITAKSKEYDCVSRTFAPKLNVPEDPVCGSGHCHIAPYWAKRNEKKEIIAYQASERGGVLYCKVKEDRIILGGKVVLYAESKLWV